MFLNVGTEELKLTCDEESCVRLSKVTIVIFGLGLDIMEILYQPYTHIYIYIYTYLHTYSTYLFIILIIQCIYIYIIYMYSIHSILT